MLSKPGSWWSMAARPLFSSWSSGTRQPDCLVAGDDDDAAGRRVRARLGREHLDLGDVAPVDALLAAVGQHPAHAERVDPQLDGLGPDRG